MTARRDNSRPCPVPMCDAGVRRGHLTCRECWSRVPRPLQAAVNQSWTALRSWRPGITSLVHARRVYDEACTAAITAAEAGR